MRYRLSTLNLILGISPPVLAVLWFLSHSIAGMIGWTAFASLFVIWYRTLLKSQAMDRRNEGDKSNSLLGGKERRG